MKRAKKQIALKPTDEQIAIIDAAKNGYTLAINALAGTGKTTTLKMIAEAMPGKKIAYLAFNKSIVGDMQRSDIPSNVSANTFHSIAFGAMKPQYNRLQQHLNGSYIAEYFNIGSIDIGERILTGEGIGRLALETLGRFYADTAAELSIKHVPSLQATFKIPDADKEKIKRKAELEAQRRALEIATKIWAEQCNPKSEMPIEHDTYVKQWFLSKPRIPADVILFDEAQDASPIFIAIVEAQSAQRIWVGDRWQQIYAWRGAVDALNRVKVDRSLYLTSSFRFGHDIAERANIVLRSLGSDHLLKGLGGQANGSGSAFLCRTNGAAIARLMLEKSGLKDVVLVGAKTMLDDLRDLKSLINGKPRGSFALFKSYHELEEHSKSPAGQEFAVLVKLIDKHGIDDLIAALNDVKDNAHRKAKLTISTIHRAKGREWDHIEIAGDWPGLKRGSESDTPTLTDDDKRLLYVAITRGRVSAGCSNIQKLLDAMANESVEEALCDEETTEVEPEEVIYGNGFLDESRLPVEKSKSKSGARKSSAERVAAYRSRKKAVGESKIEVYIPKDVESKLEAYAGEMNMKRSEAVKQILKMFLDRQTQCT